MSEPNLSIFRPLSEAEQEEFRLLELSPGNWLALAPLPLLRGDLYPPRRDDRETLAKLQKPLQVIPSRNPDLVAEAETVWGKVCQRLLRTDELEAGSSLLAWYLATRLPRTNRESFLSVLDAAAGRLYKLPRSSSPASEVSYSVRQQIDRFLPHRSYTRYPGDPRVAPPNPQDVVKVLGLDLWKQMLVAPIVSAFRELQVRPGTVATLISELTHVSHANPAAKPNSLEPHLTSSSWRRLFDGLLDPLKRSLTEPLVNSGLQIAAEGLASLPFAEREAILRTIHQQIRRGIEQSDLSKITADDTLDSLRAKMEEVLRYATPVTAKHPLPAAMVSPVAVPPSPDTRPGADLSTSAAAKPVPTEPEPNPLMAPVKTVSPPPASPMPAPASKPAFIVERPNPFSMVSFADALALADTVSVADVRAWLEKPAELLFDNQRSDCREVAIVRDPRAVPQLLWVVGDLHADVLTLANVIAHAERIGKAENTSPAFVFLGDFVDRGKHDHETLLLLFHLILRYPGKVCVLPGNHDIDLHWDERGNRFRVTIEPAEYCEHLNSAMKKDDERSREEVELARLLIPFWQGRPKAIVLPDGTFLAHAGFPHADLQPTLNTAADLARPGCISDFLWARISETARKRPNRGNRGHEFGWETLAGFCRRSAQLGLPAIKRFVRGHDHVSRRWQTYPDYVEFPVLTMNSMGRRMDGEPDPVDGPHPFPVMARYVANELPTVVPLPLDVDEVNRAFGKESVKVIPTPAISDASATPAQVTPPEPNVLNAGTSPPKAGEVFLDALNNLVPKATNGNGASEEQRR